MVGAFVQLFKLSQLNISAQRMTDLLLPRFLSSEKSKCPDCGARDFKKYRKYSRWIIEYHDGHMKTTRLQTERFRCNSCHANHAFLTALIIPYCSYSLITILWVLNDYFSHSLTVKKICEKYQISVTTLYRWKTKFLHDKELYLGVLKNAVTDVIQFLKYLLGLDDFRNFEMEFMETVAGHLHFLQNHKNAGSWNYV